MKNSHALFIGGCILVAGGAHGWGVFFIIIGLLI